MRRAATLRSSTILPAFTSRERRRCWRRGRAAISPRWIRPRSAGRCSGWARDARRPASRSIRMRALSFTRGAGRTGGAGEPLATLYATTNGQLAEPIALLKRAIQITANVPPAVPLVGQIFTRETAEAYLYDAAERAGAVKRKCDLCNQRRRLIKVAVADPPRAYDEVGDPRPGHARRARRARQQSTAC